MTFPWTFPACAKLTRTRMTLRRGLPRMTSAVNRTKIGNLIRTARITGDDMVNLISPRLMTDRTNIRAAQHAATKDRPIRRQRSCRSRPRQLTYPFSRGNRASDCRSDERSEEDNRQTRLGGRVYLQPAAVHAAAVRFILGLSACGRSEAPSTRFLPLPFIYLSISPQRPLMCLTSHTFL
jgi:hypothetical protein